MSATLTSPPPLKKSHSTGSVALGRHRIKRACTSCRLHKTKCCGNTPCKNCVRKGWLCSYDKKQRHPGKLLLTPSYLIQLEDTNHKLARAVIAMHRKLVEKDAWDHGEIQVTEEGEPVLHGILDVLGIHESSVNQSPHSVQSLETVNEEEEASPDLRPWVSNETSLATSPISTVQESISSSHHVASPKSAASTVTDGYFCPASCHDQYQVESMCMDVPMLGDLDHGATSREQTPLQDYFNPMPPADPMFSYPSKAGDELDMYAESLVNASVWNDFASTPWQAGVAMAAATQMPATTMPSDGGTQPPLWCAV